jgi:hypothetical protein
MLAAGIKTPVPLEELEIHLREEIEQQMKSGLNDQEIFNSAVQKIGRAGLLKTEFKKVGGFIDWLGENNSARINRILSVLWFVLCTQFLIAILSSPVIGATILYFPHYRSSFAVVSTALCLTGVFGSVFLFCRAKLGQYIISSLAIFGFLLSVLECVTGDESFGVIAKYWFGTFAIFSLITIWVLRSSSVKNPNAAA